jgi:hypothetical protein
MSVTVSHEVLLPISHCNIGISNLEPICVIHFYLTRDAFSFGAVQTDDNNSNIGHQPHKQVEEEEEAKYIRLLH